MTEAKHILDHTADIRVKITSESLPGLFRLGLDSLNQLLTGEKSKPASESAALLSEKFHLEARDTTLLLIDFLSLVLTRSQTNKAIYNQLNIETMTDCTLSGELLGFAVSGFAVDIKAVTYHEANVRVNENGDWETLLIFDI